MDLHGCIAYALHAAVQSDRPMHRGPHRGTLGPLRPVTLDIPPAPMRRPPKRAVEETTQIWTTPTVQEADAKVDRHRVSVRRHARPLGPEEVADGTGRELTAREWTEDAGGTGREWTDSVLDFSSRLMHECEALGDSPFGPLSLTVWLAPGPAVSNPSMPAGAAALGPASGSSQPQPLLPTAAAMPTLLALTSPAVTRGPTAAFTPRCAVSSPLHLLAPAAAATAPQRPTVTLSPRRLSSGSEGTQWGNHVVVCDNTAAGSSELTLPFTPVSHALRRASSGAVRRRAFLPTSSRQLISPVISKQKQRVIRGGRPVTGQHSGMHVRQLAIRKPPVKLWRRPAVMHGGLTGHGSAAIGGMRPTRAPVMYINRTASLHSARLLAAPFRGGRRAILIRATPPLPPSDVVMEVEREEEDMDEGEAEEEMDEGEADMEEGELELEESDVEMDEDEVMKEAGEEYSSLEAMQEDGESEEEAHHISGIVPSLDYSSEAGLFSVATGLPSSPPTGLSAGAASALSPLTAFSAGAASAPLLLTAFGTAAALLAAPLTGFSPMTGFTPDAGYAPPFFSAVSIGSASPSCFSPAAGPNPLALPLPISATSSCDFSDEEVATMSCLLELGASSGPIGLADPRILPRPQPNPDQQSTLAGPVAPSGSPPGPQQDPAPAPAPGHRPPSRQVPLAHRLRPVLRPGQAPPHPRPCSSNMAVH